MKRLGKLIVTAIVVLALCTPALAQSQIDLQTTLEKEVLVMENENFIKKFVAAEEVSPGDLVRITLTLVNNGADKATDLVLDNPVPEGAFYIQGSATEDLVVPLFSVDNGNNFKNASLLTYEITLPDGSKETRQVSPENYTNIRWTIPTIAAGTSAKVSFQAQIR